VPAAQVITGCYTRYY